MGTVWFFANSTQMPEDIALRAIVGGSICIFGILLLHVVTRKHVKASHIYYACMLLCISIVSFVLLAEAIDSIASVGATI